MKRFLSAGEGYALFPTRIKYRMPRYFPAWSAPFLCIFVFFMCLQAAVAKGTDPATEGGRAVFYATDSIRPLQIGDTIPERLWNLPLQVVNHPEGRQVITLNEYRGSLIILDFWSTWCTACIHGFRRLDFLGHHFGNAVQFLLVNSKNNNSRDQVVTFLKNEVYKHRFGFPFPCVVEELNLRTFFPHRYIPHYVWINEDGILQRVTSTSEIDLFSLKDYFRERALFSKK